MEFISSTQAPHGFDDMSTSAESISANRPGIGFGRQKLSSV